MTKKRKILLIEPNYKNKYPPIGLMKIATYHRILGDDIRFFKGDLRDLILDELTESCLNKLKKIDSNRDWQKSRHAIRSYLNSKNTKTFEDIVYKNSKYRH